MFFSLNGELFVFRKPFRYGVFGYDCFIANVAIAFS